MDSSYWRACSSSAAADSQTDPYDWYVEFSTGASLTPTGTVRSGVDSIARMESEPGYLVGAALGREMLDLIRVELRVDFREVDIDRAAGFSPSQTADGDISLTSVVANAYYDLDLGGRFTPYIGAGFGYGYLKFDFQQSPTGVFKVDDRDSVFVYNAMLGGQFRLTDVSNLTLGYRYVGITGGENLDSLIGNVDQDIRGEYEAHEFMTGIRFNF